MNEPQQYEEDVEKALRDFESGLVLQKEVVDTRDSRLRGLSGLVIKWSGGYIKDETQATYVLLAIILINLVIMSLVLFGGGDNSNDIKLLFPNAQSTTR